MTKHYETLGLKPSASQEEIKNAYHKLSLKFHPDNNDGDEYFSEMFKNFKEAYEVLSDEFQKPDQDIEDHSKDSTTSAADKPKDFSPKILNFESNKDIIEEGESIRLSWETINVDKVIIKPFGTVENSGTKVFKLKNFDKDSLSITLHATNTLIDETITKTIKLKNNVIEFDFSTIQEDEEAKTPETIEEKVELPEPVKEEPKVHANSFAPPIAKPRVQTTESFSSSDGRLRRGDYFLRLVLLAIPATFAYLPFDLKSNPYYSPDETTLIFSGLALIVITYFGWIQTIKRLHDLNNSGWLSLLQLIPFVNFVFGLYLLFSDSNKGPNKYGEDPKRR
jgi:curved DNA-binding protein CbpA